MGKIQMTASFSADMHSDQVRMEFSNFDALQVRKQTLAVAALSEEMLDSLGKYLAHQQNYVFRETVSQENREAWRAKLQQEEKRRDWEQKIAAAQAEEEEKLRRSQASRITGKFRAVTGELPAVRKPASAPPAAAPAPAPGVLGKLFGLFGKKS